MNTYLLIYKYILVMALELKLTKELACIHICKTIESMALAEFKVLRIINAYANSDLAYILVDRQQLSINAYCIRQYANHLYLFTRRHLHVYLDSKPVIVIAIPEYVRDSGMFEITHIDNILHCRIPHYNNIKYITINTVYNSIISIFNIKPYLLTDYVAPRKYFNRFNSYIAMSFSNCDEYMSHCRIHNEDTDSKYVKPDNYVASKAKSMEWLFGDDRVDSDDSDDHDGHDGHDDHADHGNHLQVVPLSNNLYSNTLVHDVECFKSIYYTLTHDVFSLYVYKNILATMSTNNNCYLYDTNLLDSTSINNYIFSFPIIPSDIIRCINAMYIINSIIYIISDEHLHICDIANYTYTSIQTPKEIRDICVMPNGILAMTKRHIYEFKKMC